MKRSVQFLGVSFVVSVCLLYGYSMTACAEDTRTIEDGIYADDINLSGMTVDEAKKKIEDRVNDQAASKISMKAVDGKIVTVTAADLGLTWGNEDDIDSAAEIGKTGNIIKRYKEIADLRQQNKVYKIEYDFDKKTIQDIIKNKCDKFNQDAVNATLKRTDGAFTVQEGKTGCVVDDGSSAAQVYKYLTEKWNGGDGSIDLAVKTEEPKGSKAELEKVKDLLGTFTTSYTTSGAPRCYNIATGCNHINGTTVYPGDEFSVYHAISPFTEENGYELAGSYKDGQVVETLGGGICQVSTTLYNAVLRAELKVTERHNHSLIVEYVDPSDDAAISESAGKDFRFVNSSDSPIYIEGITGGKHITFNIYGVETRPADRKVTYESEVLETEPPVDQVTADASLAAGQFIREKGHTGYKAKLWKIVTVAGKQTEKTLINSSVYMKTPNSVTLGVSTPDPNIYNALMAAAATGNADQAIATAEAVAAQTSAAQAATDAAAQAAVQAAARAAAQAADQVQ